MKLPAAVIAHVRRSQKVVVIGHEPLNGMPDPGNVPSAGHHFIEGIRQKMTVDKPSSCRY
jgi:hypothetical protein